MIITRHPRPYGGMKSFFPTVDYSADLYNYIYVDITQTVPNDITIYEFCVYFGNATVWTGYPAILQADGSAYYSPVFYHTVTSYTPTLGWNCFELSTPYTIPSTGSHYVGFQSSTHSLIGGVNGGARARVGGYKTEFLAYESILMTESLSAVAYTIGYKYME